MGGVSRTDLVLHVGVSGGSSQRSQPSQSGKIVRGGHQIAGDLDSLQAIALPGWTRCSGEARLGIERLTDTADRDIVFEYSESIFKGDTMGAISLKLPDDLMDTSNRCAQALRLSRAEYIRRAIERMNRETQAQLRAKRMADASRKVRDESMRVNAEFALIERDASAD